MNFVHIVGRLAKDPETRFTSGGQKVTVLVVASSSYRGGNEETIWWRVTLWGDRWDKMVQHFSKGKPIMVGGEMRKPETYTDKGGATQVGSIEVTADYVKFVPFGKTDQSEEGQQGASGKRQGKSSDTACVQFGAGVGAGFSEQGFGRQGSSEEDNLPF
jgi:single-strand DNA-binding protein